MALPVALQLYSVRDDMEKDFEGTLKKVSELGYHGVEFAGLFGKSAAEVKALCEKYSLTPISAHVPLVDMIDDTDAVLRAYKEIGCEYIVVPYVTEERRPGAEKFEETIEDIKKIGAAAEKLGLTLLYHNHDFEFIKIDGKIGLDVLYASVPENLLKTEIDTCWANVGGVDPASYVLKYTNRAPVVHLKDFTGTPSGRLYALIGLDEDNKETSNSFELRPVGYGKQDIPTILDASVKAGAKWVVVEQDNPSMGKTPLECAEFSRNYLKTLCW